MRKKITALILALACLPAIFIPQAAFAAKEDISDILNFMNKMEIISESEISEEKIDNPITRIDFALFTARALGISESGTSDKNYFYDIAEDHWGKFSINSLVEKGIISDESKNFRPDDIITKDEAAKIAVTCIGANGEADMYGGYPNGYTSVASREKLFYGFESESEMTYRNAAKLLYNMLNADIVQMDITEKGLSFVRNGETLLSVYHDIYRDSGLISAVYGASIDESVANSENDVVINGEEYEATEWLYDYLGMDAEYYYRDDNGDKTIVYVLSKTNNKNETVYIKSENYLGYKDGYVEYYTDDNRDKTSRTKISTGAAVIRNGENHSENLSEALSDFYGNMRIIESGRLSGADTVIIEDYKTIAVEYINSTDMIVYDKYDSMLSVDLSQDDGELVKYLYTDGSEAQFNSISKNGVMNVASSSDRKFNIVIISNETISGNINGKGTDSEGNKYIEIDGQQYIAHTSFFERFEGVFIIGEQGTFKTDMFGKISYYSLDKSDEIIFAYLINAYVDSEMDGEMFDTEKVIMKLFTEDGEMVKKPCAEKVKVDGVTVKGTETLMDIIASDNTVVSQLIRIKYDKDGEIKLIDTKEYNAIEGKYSLRRQENEKLVYRHWTGIIGRKAYATSSVKVMVLPPEGEEKTADTSNFMIKNISYIPSGKNSRLDIYQLDPDSVNVDMILYYQDQTNDIDTYSTLYVVEDISEALDADEKPAKSFTLNYDGSKAEYLISSKYEIGSGNTSNSYIDPDKVGIGDVVRIKTDYKNEILNMQLFFDYSKAKEDGDYNFFKNSIAPSFQIKDGVLPTGFVNGLKISYGYVAKTDDKTFMWGYDKPGDFDEIYNSGIQSMNIIVFDEDNKYNKCRIGTVDDLVGYYQSAADFSKIITKARDVAMSQMIIYK